MEKRMPIFTPKKSLLPQLVALIGACVPTQQFLTTGADK